VPTSARTDLPLPLRGTEPGSFTHRTIADRWPRIAGRVIDENAFPPPVNARLRALQEDLPEGAIRPLTDEQAPDASLWAEWVAPHQGKGWLEAPWFFGETYFYRRLLEATGYFQDGPFRQHDPFTYQKEAGLAASTDDIEALAERRAAAQAQEEAPRKTLRRLFRAALWGNQADLSMWAAGEDGPNHRGPARAEEHLLVDDSAAALDSLLALDPPTRVDLWADNAGFELVSDLALIDGLLGTEAVTQVVVHLKGHPTFVSDALVDDVHATLDRLITAHTDAVRALAERLQAALADGRLRLRDAWVWTSPLRARELPAHTRAELARADLLISKGDANYRRLLGDRQWGFATPFAEALAPLPVPVLALRTLKAEVAAGLSAAQVRRLNDAEPDWAVNGRWGLIQYAPAVPDARRPTAAP
jgi:uncharacterized protein with ATP-grasp and redox domains